MFHRIKVFYSTRVWCPSRATKGRESMTNLLDLGRSESCANRQQTSEKRGPTTNQAASSPCSSIQLDEERWLLLLTTSSPSSPSRLFLRWYSASGAGERENHTNTYVTSSARAEQTVYVHPIISCSGLFFISIDQRKRERERVLVEWCRSSKTKSERIIIID